MFAGRDDLTRDNYAAPDFQRWLTPPSSENYRGTVAECKSAPPELGAALPLELGASAMRSTRCSSRLRRRWPARRRTPRVGVTVAIFRHGIGCSAVPPGAHQYGQGVPPPASNQQKFMPPRPTPAQPIFDAFACSRPTPRCCPTTTSPRGLSIWSGRAAPPSTTWPAGTPPQGNLHLEHPGGRRGASARLILHRRAARRQRSSGGATPTRRAPPAADPDVRCAVTQRALGGPHAAGALSGPWPT